MLSPAFQYPARRATDAAQTHLLHPPLLNRSAYIFPISPIPMIPTATAFTSIPDMSSELVRRPGGAREGENSSCARKRVGLSQARCVAAGGQSSASRIALSELRRCAASPARGGQRMDRRRPALSALFSCRARARTGPAAFSRIQFAAACALSWHSRRFEVLEGNDCKLGVAVGLEEMGQHQLQQEISIGVRNVGQTLSRECHLNRRDCVRWVGRRL